MNKCGYNGKGCMSEDTCTNDYENCVIARYYDFCVLNSKECNESGLPKATYLACWRDRQPIIEKCVGCSKARNNFCTIFGNPSARWPQGEALVENKCLHADHVTVSNKSTKKKINPLKASRRAKAGR